MDNLTQNEKILSEKSRNVFNIILLSPHNKINIYIYIEISADEVQFEHEITIFIN